MALLRWPTHFKMKTQAFVCEMWTAGCVEEVCEASSNPDKSFVMGWPTYNCVAMFRYDCHLFVPVDHLDALHRKEIGNF